MFDFDAGKLLIIGVIALIVIGPKELPRVLRQVGQAVGKMRRMAGEFQGQFMDAMKEADIQSIRDEIDKVSRESKLDAHFDPARDIQSELTRSLDTTSVSAPAPAIEIPAQAVSPTDHFTLPQVDLAPAALEAPAEAVVEPGGETLVATGVAPVVAFDDRPSETGQAVPEAGAPDAAARSSRKRKIVLRKRPPLRGPHEVWNRTGAPKGRMVDAARQGADL